MTKNKMCAFVFGRYIFFFEKYSQLYGNFRYEFQTYDFFNDSIFHLKNMSVNYSLNYTQIDAKFETAHGARKQGTPTVLKIALNPESGIFRCAVSNLGRFVLCVLIRE